MTSIPRSARYVVRNQAETAEDDESTGDNNRIPQHAQHAIYLFFPDLSCLTVSFSCGIVYSRVERTPENEKKTYVYLIKRKIMKKMLVYVPGTHVSPLF